MNKDYDFSTHREICDQLIANSSSSVAEVRRKGIEKLCELGIPTTRDEAWRSTNVQPLVDTDLKYKVESELVDIDGTLLSELEGAQIVFVNGQFSEKLSDFSALPDGVSVRSINEATPEQLALEGSAFSDEGETFVEMNRALFTDGLYMEVAESVEVVAPIQLLFMSTSSADSAYLGTKNIVNLKANAKLSVVESHQDLSNGQLYFTNSVTEYVLADSAELTHYKFQDEGHGAYHIDGIYAKVAENAIFKTTNVAVGGLISRCSVYANLCGTGAHVEANGVYVGHEKQLLDHQLFVDHSAPGCSSSQLYRGILTDKSKAVFSGMVMVRPDAQKTDAQQSNKALLLSDDASVFTMPKLEIYADDVKCSHGATVGELEQEQLFYLRSRGIPEVEAIKLLTFAFVEEVVDRVDIPELRDQLTAVLQQKLENDIV